MGGVAEKRDDPFLFEGIGASLLEESPAFSTFIFERIGEYTWTDKIERVGGSWRLWRIGAVIERV